MRDTTLCFLLTEDRICLPMKKRGFGMGKHNGYGGKPEPGEDIETATLRELSEESGVTALPEALEKVAVIEFSFEGKPEWSQRVHAYFIRAWDGEPTETEEMAPAWFSFDAIPYERMWVDDPFWLPRVLAGEQLEGRFRFSRDGSEILESELHSA